MLAVEKSCETARAGSVQVVCEVYCRVTFWSARRHRLDHSLVCGTSACLRLQGHSTPTSMWPSSKSSASLRASAHECWNCFPQTRMCKSDEMNVEGADSIGERPQPASQITFWFAASNYFIDQGKATIAAITSSHVHLQTHYWKEFRCRRTECSTSGEHTHPTYNPDGRRQTTKKLLKERIC